MLFCLSFINGLFQQWNYQHIILFNHFPNKLRFSHVCSTSLLKTLWGKGEIARNEQFLLFPQCFLPVWRTFCHFYQIRNCRLQSFSVRKSKMCRLGKGYLTLHLLLAYDHSINYLFYLNREFQQKHSSGDTVCYPEWYHCLSGKPLPFQYHLATSGRSQSWRCVVWTVLSCRRWLSCSNC